jgi:hypothetical protein
LRKALKYILIIVILALVGGYIYWNNNKKKLIRQGIEEAIRKKTDSLYYIHYDSSNVDEINGDAVFYNVSLQSDDTQKNILDNANALPDALYIIKVQQVKGIGVDVAGLLQKQNVTAKKIVLTKPFIQIINTGMDNPKPFTYDDTLSLYKKILGRFTTISADTIQIINGTVLITNRKGKSLTTFENINIALNHFVVDSNHNYENIISYFVKNIQVSVENIQLPEADNNTRVNIEHLMYNAEKRLIQVKKISQYRTGNSDPLVELNKIEIDRLNTNAFIYNHRLQAGLITCNGGLITIYKPKKDKDPKNKLINFSSNLIEEAQVQGLNLGSTTIVVADPDNQTATPLIINDVRFTLPEALNVNEGNTINEIIAAANWQLNVGSFAVNTKAKKYRIDINGIRLDNRDGVGHIGKVSVKPLGSEAAFVSGSPHQKDRYDLDFNNISVKGLNFKKLLGENAVEINELTLQPLMVIFNDRTLPVDSSSKVGKYPVQQLIKLDMPLYIKKIIVRNGNVSYTEKARKSGMRGTVSFTNVNGSITNVTNIGERIKTNSSCVLDASALFLGAGKMHTQWILPLSSGNKNFSASGSMDALAATTLNQLIEPLAMASVKKGEIKKLDFNMNGNDYGAKGSALLLYNDLKIELLKKDEDNNQLTSKDLASFVANTLVKNNNPQNGTTRQGDFDNPRELNKSFFNLLWKSIFAGVKKIVMDK